MFAGKSLFCAADNEINRLSCTRAMMEGGSLFVHNEPLASLETLWEEIQQTSRTCSESRKEERESQSTCASLSLSYFFNHLYFIFIWLPSFFLRNISTHRGKKGKSASPRLPDSNFYSASFAGLTIFFLCKRKKPSEKVQSYKLLFFLPHVPFRPYPIKKKRRSPSSHTGTARVKGTGRYIISPSQRQEVKEKKGKGRYNISFEV